MAKYYYDKFNKNSGYGISRETTIDSGMLNDASGITGATSYYVNSNNGSIEISGLITVYPNGTGYVYQQSNPVRIVEYNIANGHIWSTVLNLGIVYSKGSYIETISAEDGTYPNDGVLGSYWYVKTGLFNLVPYAPILLPKSNFDATKSALFEWKFEDYDIYDTQSAFQLQIIRVSDSVVVKDTGKLTGTPNNYTIATDTLLNGVQYQWKVITWDKLDSISPYSLIGTFKTSGTPILTIVYPALSELIPLSKITCTWTFTDPNNLKQRNYMIQLYNSLNQLLYEYNSSGINDRSIEIPTILINNASYTIKLKVWNEAGIQSLESVRPFSVSYSPPATPILSYAEDNNRGSILLSIKNPTPTYLQPIVIYNDLFRKLPTENEWVRIAKNIPNNSNFIDCTLKNNTNYQYRIIATGDTLVTKDSNIMGVSIKVFNTQIASTVNYNNFVNLYGDPSKSENKTKESAKMQFSGRKFQVTEYGEHEDNELNCSFSIMSIEDLEALESLIDSMSILLYRDSRGRRIFCTITDLNIKDEMPDYWTASFNVSKTSFSEVI